MRKLNIFNKKSTGGGKLSTLLAAFILLLIVTSSTSARADGGYDFVSGNLRYKINDDGTTVTLVRYDGNQPSGELIIPATVTDEGNSYSVTAIGIRAFVNCYSLTSLTIPEGVTSIGEDAFFGVRHIINKSNCTDGRPWGARVENGTVDGDFVYEDDTKAKLLVYIEKGGDITIPESVTAIGDKAFFNCKSLTSVTIPESVTSIGESAFSDCTSLTSVTIPNSVTSIGMMAFSEVRHIINNSKCTDPLHLHWGALAENGTVDGDLVYEDDTKTNLLVYIGKGGEVTIPEGVTSIGERAFINCTSLTSVTIPKSVTSIGVRAFYNCTSLTSVTIPEGVTSIGNYAFNGVRHIINKSNCTDGRPWGARVENGTVDGDFVYENDTKAKLLVYIGKGGDITIPESVTAIGERAFMSCTSLTSVTIPESVTSIGEKAFIGCTSLTSVTIPESVTSIGSDAFFNCTSVDNVYLYANPDNLTWSENACDDFITNPKGATKCHVLAEYVDKYKTKFKNKVNVTFEGDIKNLSSDAITISGITDVTYTGKALEPIVVTDGDKTLTPGTDYTITYTNNINAGTAKATITGITNLCIGSRDIEFTIAPAPLTVTAENKTKAFGESDPEFTANVSGLVNNESADLIKYTFSRKEGENVGEYTITPKGDEKQGNYVVSFVDATLTITKATPNPEPQPNPEPEPQPEPDPQNPSTPVSSIDNGGNNVKVWSYAHTIYIASTPDSQYKIIDLQGRTIATSSTTSSLEQININNSGILVVIINGKSYKVSL